jgi:hypothetical protein
VAVNVINSTDEPVDVRITLTMHLEPGEDVATRITEAIHGNFGVDNQVNAVLDLLGITREVEQ